MHTFSGAVPWEIRLLDTPDALPAAEALQRAVWSGSDLEIVPGHVLLTAMQNGGLAAGAWAGPDRQLAGLVFGFLGFHGPARRLKHCSHMLGIHPDYRNQGLGAALKIFQRDFVLRQGLDLITWTYDPLLARNAHLNIAKLGAVCSSYLENLYGDLADDLNSSLATDRLRVDWWIRSPRVAERTDQRPVNRLRLMDYLTAGALVVNPTDESGRLEPPLTPALDVSLPPIVLLAIPVDFLALKAADWPAALSWRLSVRDALKTLFSRGYTVVDFIYERDPTPRAAYVLTTAHTRPTEAIP